MIAFPELTQLIRARGVEGHSLSALSNEPSSRAFVGILASRINFKVLDRKEQSNFDLYICHDSPDARVLFRSPFGLICLRTDGAQVAADTLGLIYDMLHASSLHTGPSLVIFAGPIDEYQVHFSNAALSLVTISIFEALDILLAHPPRTSLMQRVVSQARLSALNPYVFRGPVRGHLFVNRQQEITKLLRLEKSYALVGPRTIGKTSLLRRAYESLKERTELALQLEYSSALTEAEFCEMLLSTLVNEYNLPPILQRRASPTKIQQLLGKLIHQFPARKAVLLIDEADEFHVKCPRLAAAFRALHNLGQASIILAGFKDLRKAANDAAHSDLMNVFEPLPITRVAPQDCGSLVLMMTNLRIELQRPEKIIDIIFQLSGGSPSRIQLLCYALVEQLSLSGKRLITPESVSRAIHIPLVRGVLADWFRESTTAAEKWLLVIAGGKLPCTETELISYVNGRIPEWTENEIANEVGDLRTADVLDFLSDGSGKVGFTFSALSELARPSHEGRPAFEEAIREMKQLIQSNRRKQQQ